MPKRQTYIYDKVGNLLAVLGTLEIIRKREGDTITMTFKYPLLWKAEVDKMKGKQQ